MSTGGGHDGTGGDTGGGHNGTGGDTGHNRWSADRAFALFEARTNLEKGGTPHLRQYRLERMGEILRRLGNPHLTLPTIHLAGSKGKGSTAAFTAHVLAAAGARTGLYTSPHVTGYRERFRVLPAWSAGSAAPAGSADPAAPAGDYPLQIEPLLRE